MLLGAATRLGGGQELAGELGAAGRGHAVSQAAARSWLANCKFASVLMLEREGLTARERAATCSRVHTTTRATAAATPSAAAMSCSRNGTTSRVRRVPLGPATCEATGPVVEGGGAEKVAYR